MAYNKNKNTNLRKIRKERKLTIKEVCEKTGIPVRTYQNYEYGDREMTATVIQKLADFYGVSTDYILGCDTADNEDTFENIAKEYNLTPLERKILTTYLELPDDMRKEAMKLAEYLVNKPNTEEDN
ncbi:MAG: helix-turn-helix domain-containing protein [Clostridiales bacterium]|nr:helix-turn-helix domain-containing protein [Clostridiales bacterium]